MYGISSGETVNLPMETCECGLWETTGVVKETSDFQMRWSKPFHLVNGMRQVVTHGQSSSSWRQWKQTFSVGYASHRERGGHERGECHRTEPGRRGLTSIPKCLKTDLAKGIPLASQMVGSTAKTQLRGKISFWVWIWEILRQFPLLFLT